MQRIAFRTVAAVTLAKAAFCLLPVPTRAEVGPEGNPSQAATGAADTATRVPRELLDSVLALQQKRNREFTRDTQAGVEAQARLVMFLVQQLPEDHWIIVQEREICDSMLECKALPKPQQERLREAIRLEYLAKERMPARQFAAARENLDAALAVYQQIGGRQSCFYVKGLSNLAIVERELGNSERARELLAEALTLTEKIYGTVSLARGELLLNIGEVDLALNEYARSEANLTEACQILRRTVGEEYHLHVLGLSYLAVVEMHRGSAEGALEQAKEVHKLVKVTSLPAGGTLEHNALFTVALVLRAHARLKGSATALEHLIGIAESASERSSDTAMGAYYRSHAAVLHELGDDAGALRSASKAEQYEARLSQLREVEDR